MHKLTYFQFMGTELAGIGTAKVAPWMLEVYV